jgi:SAM-dependent methyltransferase
MASGLIARGAPPHPSADRQGPAGDRYADRIEGYDPTNAREEGTLRAHVLCELLRRQGALLTRGRLLDLGCGYGGLSIYAAQEGATVTAVDVNQPVLEVLARRLKEPGFRGAQRIRLLRAGATSLPFESGSFDQVITVGVIEWVPLASGRGDPREVQLQALREICRTLAPGGTYVLGAKNRWHPKYALREPQIRRPIVNHLPRRLASRFSRWIYRHDYRTYTHDLRDWEVLLEQAGFRSVQSFLPIFDYQFPLDLWPARGVRHEFDATLASAATWIPPRYLESVQPRRGPVKRWLLPLALRTRLERLLWPAFLFVART